MSTSYEAGAVMKIRVCGQNSLPYALFVTIG